MSAERIRELNDLFRTTMTGGRMLMTAGVNALPSDVKAMVVRRVATFSEFNDDNDPHGEHDFGNFSLAGRKFFFKIDYYDANMEFGSEDPTDPRKRRACSRLCLLRSTDHIPPFSWAGVFYLRRFRSSMTEPVIFVLAIATDVLATHMDVGGS